MLKVEQSVNHGAKMTLAETAIDQPYCLSWGSFG